MVYFPTFTTKINQMQVNIPYMDGMGTVTPLHTIVSSIQAGDGRLNAKLSYWNWQFSCSDKGETCTVVITPVFGKELCVNKLCGRFPTFSDLHNLIIKRFFIVFAAAKAMFFKERWCNSNLPGVESVLSRNVFLKIPFIAFGGKKRSGGYHTHAR